MNIFQKQQTIGIDISDYSIEILQLNKNKEILAYGRTVLLEGIVQDGKILDKKELAQQINSLLTKTEPKSLKDIKGLKVVLSLPESQVFIHHLEIEQVAGGGDLKQLVLNEASKIVPLDQQDICWDFMEMSTKSHLANLTTSHSKIENKKIEILYVGALKSVVDDYIEVFSEAGLELVAIDTESLSLGRALINSGLNEDYVGKMIVDIGARSTVIGVFDKECNLNLSINIPVAGNNFTKKIALKLKKTEEEAENFKKIFGFDTKKPDNQILPILQEEFQVINKEIKNAIDYYEKNTGEKVSEIILSGGSSLLPKIVDYLELSFERKVIIGNPLNKIKNSSNLIQINHPVYFANVVGLALRGVSSVTEGINLLKNYNKKTMLISKEKNLSLEEDSTEIKSEIKPSKQFGSIIKSSGSAVNSILILVLVCLSAIVLSFVFYIYIYKPLFAHKNLQKNNNTVKVYDRDAVIDNIINDSKEGDIVNTENIQSAEQIINPDGAVPTEESLPVAGIDTTTTEESLPVGADAVSPENVQDTVKEIVPVLKIEQVIINKTPTGWLNTRTGPGTNYPQVTRVLPGNTYDLLEEKNGWYYIKIDEKSAGWITSKYATKQ